MSGLRELDRRETHGLVVTLLWSKDENKVFVSVDDARFGLSEQAAVPAARAREAFEHPYAYLPTPSGPVGVAV